MTRVVIAPDAVERLAAQAPAQALVVSDANTHEALAARLAASLPGAGELVFAAGVRPGPAEIERVRAALAAREQAVPIAVGSGVITDLVRYAAHLLDRDFLSVPTAASMDGYASGVAALEIDGVKVTYQARAPRAIFADPRVAAAAPPELTRAGIGDLLAKASARVDWLAAHLLYGEPFDAQVADRVLASMTAVAADVAQLLDDGADASAALLRGLVESGTAMAIVGSSRPASGCEHHASHFWDLLAARGMRAYGSHGLQVGYATRFALRLQLFAFGGGVARLRPPVPAADPLGAAAREWLGEPTAEIVAAVEEKQRLLASACEADWDEVRRAIAPTLELFDTIDAGLAAAGIPLAPGFLGIDERTLRATFAYAMRLRARYTTVDFLEGQGRLDDAIDAVIPPSPPAARDR